MKDVMNKAFAVKVLLIIWIVFSAGYIAKDVMNTTVNKKVQQAYKAAYTDSVKALINESKKCEPIQVYEGENKVELISIDCLQQAINSQNASEGSETTE